MTKKNIKEHNYLLAYSLFRTDFGPPVETIYLLCIHLSTHLPGKSGSCDFSKNTSNLFKKIEVWIDCMIEIMHIILFIFNNIRSGD